MATKDGGDPATTARNNMETARVEVMECEKQIHSIKEALRGITASNTSTSGTADSADSESNNEDADMNTVKISALKVSGLPETAKPSFKIQVSSPIEEISISRMFDPLNPDAEGSIGIVRDVDVSVATLTVTSVNDADIYLGSSLESYDMAPLCNFDPLGSKHTKISQLDVAILSDEAKDKPESTPATSDSEKPIDADVTDENIVEEKEEEIPSEPTKTNTLDESKIESSAANPTSPPSEPKSAESDKEVENKEKESTTSDKTSEITPSAIVPICVVTFRVEFTPSKKEEKDNLYQLLNTASKKKSLAVEKLRKTAAALSQVRQTNESSTASSTTSTLATSKKPNPAVKSGFLNKKVAKKQEPNFIMRLYNRSIGPESLFRKIFPVAKNYCLFFGAVALFHFKGHELALPAPV